MNDLPPVPAGAALPPPPVVSTPPAPPVKSFYHQAATCSVWILLFPLVIQFFEAPAIKASSDVGDANGAYWIRLFFAVVIALAMLTGVVLGIVALFGIPKYGIKGILIKSLFGVLIPILLLLLSIPVMMHAQERAARIRAMQEANPEPGK